MLKNVVYANFTGSCGTAIKALIEPCILAHCRGLNLQPNAKMMPTICVIENCGASFRHGVSIFSFPKNPELCKQWMELIRARLPSRFQTPESLRTKGICHRHFSDDSYNFSNNSRRLKPSACPLRIDPIKEIRTANKAVQCKVAMVNRDIELTKLKKQVAHLKKRLEKLRSDPPASFIKEHRAKLRSYLTSETYSLLDECIKKASKRPKEQKCDTHTDWLLDINS